jgi:hypothetical protein
VKSASLLAACPLAAGQAGACAWCGADLPPRRRTWCGERCSNAFWSNHWWTLARRAAKRRDKYRCRRCGHTAPKRPARVRYPSETAFRNAMRAWRKEKSAGRVEVNHREPALGAHGTLSCIHHLENLETLCVACHREVTAASRRERSVSGGVLPGDAPKRTEVPRAIR